MEFVLLILAVFWYFGILNIIGNGIAKFINWVGETTEKLIGKMSGK